MNRYSNEAKDFFAECFARGLSYKETAEAVSERFGIEVTPNKVKSYASNYHLRNGNKVGIAKEKPTKLFPEEIYNFIIQNYKGVGSKDMTEQVNALFNTEYTRGQIKSFYKNRRLNSGTDGRFLKGHIPFNKGQKGMKMHPNSVATQFKAGHTPANKMPIGTVMRKDDGYLWRKTGEGARDWKQEHVIRYEEAHGPVPKGDVVTFLDGNRENLKLTNLKLISRRENAILNHKKLRSSNAEITNAGITLAKLMVNIKDNGKKNEKTI